MLTGVCALDDLLDCLRPVDSWGGGGRHVPRLLVAALLGVQGSQIIIRNLTTMILQAGMLLWLLLPSTRGSTLLYRRLVHPTLVAKEKEIDAALDRCPFMFKLFNTDTQCILDGGRRVTLWG